MVIEQCRPFIPLFICSKQLTWIFASIVEDLSSASAEVTRYQVSLHQYLLRGWMRALLQPTFRFRPKLFGVMVVPLLVTWYGMAGTGGGKLIAQIIDACLSIHHLSG